MDHSAISKYIWTLFPWVAVGFAALGILFPVSLAFVPGVLSIMAVAATGIVGTRAAIAENKAMLFWIAGLCAMCFFSVVFSITPQESAERAAKITALIALSIPFCLLVPRLPAAVTDAFWRYLPPVLVVSGGILAIELYFNFPLYKIVSGKGEAFLSLFLANKNVAVFTLLLPLGLYAAWKNGARSVAGVLGLIAAALFLKTDSQAAQCAMIVMIVVGLGLMVCKRTVIDGAFMMAALLLVIFPFVSQPMMDHLADPVSRYEKTVLGGATAAMRIENYSFISKRILEEPLSGHGIDTTRHMTFETDAIYFPDNKILHPHNVYLQIWLEFGAYGAVFFLGFLFFIWRAVRCSTGHAQYLRVTFFCMLMVFLSISWSMWASWLIGTTVFVSAMVRMADTAVKDKQAC